MPVPRPLPALLCLLAGPFSAQAAAQATDPPRDPMAVAAADFATACLYTNASTARAAAALARAGYAPSRSGIFTRSDLPLTAMIVQSPDGLTRGCGVSLAGGDAEVMTALVEQLARATWGASAERSATGTGTVTWSVRTADTASTMALLASDPAAPVMTLMTFRAQGFSN